MELPEPHWEHGHRVHGYWIGGTQYGRVSIGPGRGAARDGYNWSMDFPLQNTAQGHTKTLRAAKLAVQRAFAAKRAEMGERRVYLASQPPHPWT
jgi:hypothetical protein